MQRGILGAHGGGWSGLDGRERFGLLQPGGLGRSIMCHNESQPVFVHLTFDFGVFCMIFQSRSVPDSAPFQIPPSKSHHEALFSTRGAFA